eukprot:Gb_11897 [translate_table: standard]
MELRSASFYRLGSCGPRFGMLRFYVSENTKRDKRIMSFPTLKLSLLWCETLASAAVQKPLQIIIITHPTHPKTKNHLCHVGLLRGVKNWARRIRRVSVARFMGCFSCCSEEDIQKAADGGNPFLSNGNMAVVDNIGLAASIGLPLQAKLP